MLILNASDLRTAWSMPSMLPAMRHAFESISNGQAIIPERTHLHLPEEKGVLLVMPAFNPPSTLSTKVFAVMSENAVQGLPSFQGATVLLDAETGECLAVIDAGTLTSLRTGASCGVATELLSREDSASVAVFGAGPQALASLEAILLVRTIKEVHVLDRHRTRIEAWLAANGKAIHLKVGPPDDIVSNADIVLTATPSQDPLFGSESVRPGTHISALGSFHPRMQELPPELIARARVFVDNATGADSSGDFIRARQDGVIHIVGTVGDILTSQVQGRTGADEVTLYKSVGNAIQDAVAARTVYLECTGGGIGQRVSW